MFNWIREILEIKAEFRERKLRLLVETQMDRNVCSSCETLKIALERANFEKDKLLSRLLEKPDDRPPVFRDEPQQVVPRNVPWNIRRQMLEREDREKARIMREAPKPNINPNSGEIEEFEKELRDAESNRSQSSSGIS